MIKIGGDYTDYFEEDSAYPGGKAIDAKDAGGVEGTPIKADWMNDINGFFQALIMEAYHEFNVSGYPDNADDSERLCALLEILKNRIDAHTHTGGTGNAKPIQAAGIADNAVVRGKIKDGEVITDKIADLNVTEGKIGAGAVTNLKIGSKAVKTANIDDGAVDAL
ncbi:MAG: hypothetical protein LBC99_06650, partial [Spirochaetota bacterium]|nr:hypothetical protein [Spirochaetota bacterium]